MYLKKIIDSYDFQDNSREDLILMLVYRGIQFYGERL